MASVARISPLTLGEVLGSVFGSIVAAQEQAARSTIDFVRDVGFVPTEAGETPKLQTLALRYTKRDENDQRAEFEVHVPLLAMVNIPALAVSKATVSFSYEISSVSTPPAEAGAEQASLPGSARIASLRGVVRAKQPAGGRPQSASSIDVDVTIEQQAAPVGFERLMDLAELAIEEDADRERR